MRQNTKKTYSSHQQTFVTLCSGFDINPQEPLTEDQLCLLIAAYCSNHKITTLPAFVSALSNLAKQQHHPELPRYDTYQQVVAGLKNYYGDTNASAPKTALTLSDLCAIHAHISHATFEGARDWCACLFAFFGLLRINEYMNGGLQAQHVRRTVSGISLQITFSKTSLLPTTIDIISRDDELCPSRAYTTYMAFFSSPLRPTDALFVSGLRSTLVPMTDAEFIGRVRTYIRGALPGRDPNDFAGHSFRRGGTSSMKLAGVSDSTIQQHGRWKSEAYRTYFDRQNNLDIRLLATRGLHAHPARRQ